MKREQKAKKALSFVEAGKYIEEADKLKVKEERKLIAGYSSGRKELEVLGSESSTAEPVTSIPSETELITLIPPPPETHVPTMEWWDEAFLKKDKRDNRKASKFLSEQNDFEYLLLENNKFYKFVQHPIPVKPLGGEKIITTIPMYLTKKERKKIRKSTRAEREQEKRDKILMGLIPVPEPKFKLSNFMKVLGDQAVADPSKVELKVLQQMQQRVLNHEMRNLAAKLTPQERKEKKVKKLHEDTSRCVHVSLFSVKDTSNLKHRFKIDVNAQQHFLTGLVLLCPSEQRNLVVVEGGPKGVRKFVKLMKNRIKWSEKGTSLPKPSQLLSVGNESYNYSDEVGDVSDLHQNEVVVDEEEDKVEVENNDEEEEEEEGSNIYGTDVVTDGNDQLSNNRCDLLWQGIIPKRIFTGFKFQECKSSSIAKKLLEAKNVSHYWDMVMRSDEFIRSGRSYLGE